MAKLVELYECEICGSQYRTQKEAECCENRHKTFIKEVFALYDKPQNNNSNETPDKLVATFANGAKATYYKEKSRSIKAEKRLVKENKNPERDI